VTDPLAGGARPPYRDAALPRAPAFADTRRLLRATWATMALAALGCMSLGLPVVAGRSVAREALDALALEGSLLPAAVVTSILGITAWAAITGARSIRRGSPPLRNERRALSVATVLFVGLHVVLGHAMLREAAAVRMAVLLPVVVLPAALLAAGAAWRCEGWEGWAYALGSIALGLAGSGYTTALLSAARGDVPGVVLQVGGYVHLTVVAALVLVAAWAAAPLAKVHDLYTYAGMGALAAAIDALGMSGLALLQGVRSAADLLGPYDHRAWWESYFLAREVLGVAALGLALTSVLFARQRRYGVLGLVMVGMLVKVAAV
jgi:hypothetical protein